MMNLNASRGYSNSNNNNNSEYYPQQQDYSRTNYQQQSQGNGQYYGNGRIPTSIDTRYNTQQNQGYPQQQQHGYQPQSRYYTPQYQNQYPPQQQQQQQYNMDYRQQPQSRNSRNVGGGGRMQQQQQPQASWDQEQEYNQSSSRSTIVDELRIAIRASNMMSQQQQQQQVTHALQQQQGKQNRMRSSSSAPPQPATYLQQPMSTQAMMQNANMPNTIPFTLSDIRGHALELAQDQYGSRWLQQQLCSTSVSQVEKQRLFAELLPNSLSLASDTFGNYCVQILLNPAVGTPEQQRLLCLKAFDGHMIELSRNTYACRCIQSLIKLFQLGDSVIPLSLQDRLLNELEPEMLNLVTDSNANHVIQQILERIRPPERMSFVLKAFATNYVTLAKDPFGCRVCQRVLEHAPPDFVESALEELLSDMEELVCHSMGNYVIQHILTAYAGSSNLYPKQRAKLVACVKLKLLPFATHKFASNVVEKVLEYGDHQTRRELIGLMLEERNMTILMGDLFANYVVQRSLSVADRDQLIRLVHVVRQNANDLRRMTYGKHILAACDKAAMAAGIQ
jgi:hypothetical protein